MYLHKFNTLKRAIASKAKQNQTRNLHKILYFLHFLAKTCNYIPIKKQ